MKNRVAIIYDFDLTLSNKEMQEFGLFDAIGTDNDSFMQVVRKFAKDNNSDLILSFMLKILEFAKSKGESPFIVVLDEIEDPHNLGSIMRSAEGAGVHGIIIPKRHSVGLNSTVAKTSAGAIEYMRVAKVSNIASTIEKLKKEGIWFYATHQDATMGYDEADYSGGVGIVIGSEGKGVSRIVAEKCDFLISIPMKGKINSLNASVAAGIIIYNVINKKG